MMQPIAPPDNRLSQTMQRIGKELISASDPSTVVISESDSTYLFQAIGIYMHMHEQLRFVCVLYAYVTCAEEIKQPSATPSVYACLMSIYGAQDAYQHVNIAEPHDIRGFAEVVGYARTAISARTSRMDRNPFFNVLTLAPHFVEYVELVDQTGEVRERGEEQFTVEYAGVPPSDVQDDGSIVDPAVLDPDDCPVYIMSDSRDDFTESEFEKISALIDEMSVKQMEDLASYIGELWWGPLAEKECRIYVRNHPILGFSYHDGGIITARLDEMQQILYWKTDMRKIGPTDFYDDYADVDAVCQRSRVSMRDIYIERECNSDEANEEMGIGAPALDKLQVQDCVDIIETLIDGDLALPQLMSHDDVAKFERILGGQGFTPEHYAVLSSAVVNTLYAPLVDGVLEPPTARVILGDVVSTCDLRNKLKIVWELTLHGLLHRAEASNADLVDPQHLGDPLYDHYVVSDNFLNTLDTNLPYWYHGWRPPPIKRTLLHTAEIGYDFMARTPMVVRAQGDTFTKQEWEDVMSVLNIYHPDELTAMWKELAMVWLTYRKTNILPDVHNHPVFGMAVFHGTIRPLRLYTILYTLLYNKSIRTHPLEVRFYRPDAPHIYHIN